MNRFSSCTSIQYIFSLPVKSAASAVSPSHIQPKLFHEISVSQFFVLVAISPGVSSQFHHYLDCLSLRQSNKYCKLFNRGVSTKLKISKFIFLKNASGNFEQVVFLKQVVNDVFNRWSTGGLRSFQQVVYDHYNRWLWFNPA